jgi:hypothetical protein
MDAAGNIFNAQNRWNISKQSKKYITVENNVSLVLRSMYGANYVASIQLSRWNIQMNRTSFRKVEMYKLVYGCVHTHLRVLLNNNIR